MEERKLTCIGCPMGCPLTVVMNGKEVVGVTGNTCKRGDVYARKEVTNPTRIVTSTVRVSGGSIDMVSVKTKEDIPKGKIFECVKALKGIEVPAPVHIGDVILENVKRGINKTVGIVSNEKSAFLLDETHDAGRLTKIQMLDLESNILSKKGLILNTSFGNCSELDCDFSIFTTKETLYLEVKTAGEKIEKVKLN